MKKGQLIIKIGSISYYYFGKDHVMTENGKPCHFLTTDLENTNCCFRVGSNTEEWKKNCRKNYRTFYGELEIVESSIGDFKAFWTLNDGTKYAAFKHHGNLWCLCYDGFSIGKNKCPLIADNFESLSKCIRHSSLL